MKDRISTLMEQMPGEVDAVLITSRVSRRYLTGFSSSAGTVVGLRSGSFLLIDSRYVEAARNAVKNCAVILQEKLYDQLGDIFQKNGIRRVAVENEAVTLSQLEAFQRQLPGVEFLTGGELSKAIQRQRMIKTREELDCIDAAQRISEKVFDYILEFIKPGVSEIEIAAEMDYQSRKLGSEMPAFDTIVASGSNSSMPHAVPSGKLVQGGDFITMDYGATVNGYRSDMTRTVAVGSASDEQREVYQLVLSAQKASLEAIRAGVPCKAVDKAARDLIDSTRYKGLFGHGLGHCLGLEVHENPRCNTVDDSVLEAGMVTSVEPGVYLPGKFGVRIEDLVAVTGDGYHNFTTCPKELIVL